MVYISICKVHLYGELIIPNIFTKFIKYGFNDNMYINIIFSVLQYMYNIYFMTLYFICNVLQCMYNVYFINTIIYYNIHNVL